jgi:hypothetical protein
VDVKLCILLTVELSGGHPHILATSRSRDICVTIQFGKLDTLVSSNYSLVSGCEMVGFYCKVISLMKNLEIIFI